MSNKEKTYSTRLFDKQFVRIKAKLDDLLKDKSIKFKGIWVFTYIKGANSLQSIYFNHVEIDNLKQDHDKILKEIEKTCLDCDYGSLGYAFQELNAKDNEIVKFLKNTYDDPKGTVCYYDIIISQRHACFVKIKEGNHTLGVLDLFFDGDMEETYESKIVEFFKEGFDCSKGCQYLTDFINAFTIKEYERFLELQDEKNVFELETGKNIKELGNAVEYIERIIASSSMAPLMVIKHKRGEYIPELVVLNYDFIHSIIKHEQRFCSLTADKDCFYFKECKSFINNALCCKNDFMKLFYYDVLKKLNAVVIAKKINVVNVGYDVEIVCSCENIEIDESIFEALSNEVSKNDKLKNVIAINKYRDERVYLKLEEILREKDCVYAFSLSRIIKPHLRIILQLECENSDCCQRNDCVTYEIKRFISPSTILPVQCLEKENKYLKSIESERKNIVHFQITNEKDFKKTLKQLIAINKDIYLKALSPYLNRCDNVHIFGYKNLIIDSIGEDPLKDNKFSEIIKGKYSLIEAILQENEVKLQATRAGISQVMARNMSHNIGSHVMSKLINGLNTIDWTTTKYESKTENGKKISNKLQDGIEPDKKLIEQLTILNDYMRCRMDYLADIALGTPVMQYGKRVGLILDDFDRVRLLLEHISGLSDFTYSIVINDPGITVAMPNNILGCQAFYNIIENIIRNTAKHSGVKEAQFIIEIDEASAKKEKTSSEKDEMTNATTDDLNEYYKVTIYDNVNLRSEIQKRVDEQNEKINSSIIDSNYRLRHGSLGMAEMKASASYLRREDLAHIDSEITPPLLQACEKDGKYLGYEFYLRKPKEVLYILQKSSDIELSEELKSEGFDSLSIEEFLTLLGNGKIFHHKFVIFEKTVEEQLTKCYEQYNSSLPLRRISKDSIKINSSDSLKTLLESIWGDWSKLKGYDGYKTHNGFPDNGEKILSFFNHQESVIIDNLNNHSVESIIERKVFIESIGNLAHKYLPYNQDIPLVEPIKNDNQDSNENNIKVCNKINENDIDLYLAFLRNDNYRSIQNNSKFIAYRQLVLNQLIEAAMARVVVIDERIQSFADNEQDDKQDNCEDNQNILKKDKYRKLMNLVNVFIPTNETINLSGSNLKKGKTCLDRYIEEQLKKDTMFLVLHYGILERIYKGEIKTRLNNWSGKCTIIVTSGRGSYFEIPEKIRFINLSNIHNAFIEVRNKYYIVSLLHSTRKKGGR
jgi:hypothetical protein